MPYNAALCALNAKYIHSSLAPWCLAAGVACYAPQVCAAVVEGTVNEPPQQVLARILAVEPQAVTFSCYLWNIEETLRLAAALKAQQPKIAVVLGGPEVSYNAAEVLGANPQVDFILSGEGEESVPALLRCLAAGKVPQQGEIAGLCGRENGAVYTAAPCVPHGEPPSPYTQAYLQALNGRIAYLETSRGCPYRCAFCLSGRCGAPRWYSLKNAKQNLLVLANSGAQTIKFIDRTFNANAAHANALLEFIAQQYGTGIPQGVRIHFEIAGDILREDTLCLLEALPVGAVQLEVGLQSFCARTLDAVRRKTDVLALQRNLARLVRAGNLHVHIDLIAGLPYETLPVFAQSFNTAYAVGAQMLQLGFLKLLHGAAMREEPAEFPCEFSPLPPYEVCSTPWLCAEELAVLHTVEDALERVYNSGRFLQTAEYVLKVCGQTPFAFYRALGAAAQQAGLGTHHVALDAYTAFLFDACAALPHVDKALLRDAMVCDRLATNATGRLPACLQVSDARLSQAVKALAKVPSFAPQPGVRRGVALLYGRRAVCFVDYTQKNPVTGRYLLHLCSVDKLGLEW